MRSIKISRIQRTVLFLSAALIVSWPAPPTSAAQSIKRLRLTAGQCQPLTNSNYEACCLAINRASILSRAQLDQCPPLTTAQISNTVDREHGGGTGNDGSRDGGRSRGNGGKSERRRRQRRRRWRRRRRRRWRRRRRRWRRRRRRRWRRRRRGSVAAPAVKAPAVKAPAGEGHGSEGPGSEGPAAKARQRRPRRRRRRRWWLTRTTSPQGCNSDA